MNYLPDAANHGADIFCNVNVDHVEKNGNNWLTYFEVFGNECEKFSAPMLFVRSANVIVAGGALGSTEILLRSRDKGLAVSSKLGDHFTGNGDVLGFSYDWDREVDTIK